MIAEKIASLLRPQAVARGPTDPFWYGAVPTSTSAGIDMTIDGSMRITTVFACVRVLAETLGSMPVHVFERTEINDRPARQLAEGHNLYETINLHPNVWQTSQELHEMAMTHLCLRGNFFCETVQGVRGAVTSLIPRHPDRITIEQMDDGERRYKHRPQTGSERIIPQNRMWHVMLFSLDGLIGCTPIGYAANAVALAAAAEEHGGSSFKNGLVPPFYISREAGKPWTPQAIENFRGDWKGMHGGAENASNPPIMEDGMELKALGVTNEDAQFMDLRQYQVADIARIFRVPLHLVGDLTRATFSNIGEQDRAFLKWTMLPYTRRFEQTASRDLLSDPRFFLKYSLDSLMRGDPAARAAFYKSLFELGVFSINDLLELEDRNPIGPEGDQRFIASNNLQPLEQVGQEPAAERVPVVAPEQEPEQALREEAITELVEDAAARIVAAEVRGLGARAHHAAAGRERFNAWAGEFYDKHRGYCEKVLWPVVGVLNTQGNGLSSSTVALEWCGLQLDELNAAEDVPGRLDLWAETKPAVLAEILLRK